MHSATRLAATALGLLASCSALAQRHVRAAATLLMPEAQVELGLKGNDYLLAAYSLVGTTRPSYSDRGNRVEGGQLRLGYEHFWSEHWSAGATLRYVGPSTSGNGEVLGLPGRVAPGLLLRHRGALGPVMLGQRLGVEYVFNPLNYYGLNGKTSDNRALARLRLDAEHVFTLSDQLALRPRLAYEALAYLRFQRDEGQLKERFVDFGSLRGEVGVRLSPAFDVTPWFAYQTIYRNALYFFDSSGNVVSGGRTNYRIPVVGLDLRYTLGAGAGAAARLALPSQH